MQRDAGRGVLGQLNLLQTSAAVGDLVMLLGLYAWLVTGFAVYGPDRLRVATWCAALGVVWLAFAVRNGAYRVSLLRERCRSPYVAAKVAIMAGAVFHL